MKLRATLLVAILCSLFTGTAWADETIEITYSNFSNTSYNTSESTFSQSGFTFGYVNAMRNGSNNTPTGWAKDQVIQTKSGGSIYNKTAIPGLKNIRVYIVANTNSFTITSGTTSSPTSNSVTRPSTATGTESITYSSYANKIVTEGQTTTANYYDFAVSNDFFKIAPGGSLYIWKIVLTYDDTPTYALTITEPTGGTITVLNDEANEVSSGDKFEEGAELTISAEASTGYTFSTWTKTDGAFSEAATSPDNTFTMPASAATIGATFTKNSYDLTLTNTNGSLVVMVDGVVWDGTSKIPYNAEVEITATPNYGYLFGEWASTDIGEYDEVSNPLTFNMPAGDVEIDASFVDASSYYSITVDGDVTGGTIVADKASAAEAATINLTATPSAGYTFTSWSVKDEGDNPITVTDNQFTMPASNVTVTATFTAIAVTGITLNKTDASMGFGDTETLTATVTPANALNKNVTWTSSNPSVATVADGVVTAVAVGSATITATTEDGDFTATCAVTVENVVTFTAGTDLGLTTSNADGDEVTKSEITISSDCAAFATAEYRMYKNSETTISTSTGKIIKIEFTGTSSNPASGFASQSGWTTEDYDGTWTGSAASVTFTASGAQVRATKIKVYVATTAAPTFSVEAGEYSSAQSVELSCATDGATIYYTTNGDTPTSSSTAYSSAIAVTETMTLKAIAIKSGVESDVVTATYTMNRPAAPTFDVATCVFDAAFDLHLSAADGTTIYYTTDGTTPTSSSSAYSTKVVISTATTTVKAIAVKNGLTSDVASATYTYDSRTTPTFTLSTTSLNLKVNEISSVVTLTTNSDATPSFSCEDGHVTLTGTGNSRTISANAAGTYTVNVSVTGSATYKDAAGSITVNVTKKATTMAIVTTFDDGKDLYTASEGLIEGSVKYNDVALDPQPTVTYSSSDETVATVDEDGIITFVKAGSTTITVSYAGNAEYEECEESYELVLIDSTPQETSIEVTTNYEWLGVSSGGSLSEFPKEIDCSGVTATISGAGTKTRGDDTYIRLYAKNTLQLTAPTGYYVTKVVFDHKAGSNTVTVDGGTWMSSTSTWTGGANSVKFTIGGTSGNNQINGFTVTLAETVTVGSAGYTTYVAKHDITFPEGVTAYIATKRGESTVTLTSKESVPEGTAVVLEASAGTYALPAIKTTPDDVTGNRLQASDGSITGDGNTIFALGIGKVAPYEGQVGFFLVNSGQTVPAGKAYMEISGGSSVKGFTFDFSDADGIQSINNEQLTMDNDKAIFNLAGQRLNKLQKGINIVNGKKVLMK